MKKPDFKQLLIEKGEKIGLAIAGGLMLLLMLIGIINLADIPDSGAEEFPKKIGEKTKQIQGYMNGPGVEPTELVSLKPGSSYPFDYIKRDPEPPRLVFNPVAPPDDRRTNPTVLAISEIYAEPVLGKIPSFDIVELNGVPHIGVLVSKDTKIEGDQKGALKQALGELGVRFKKNRRTNPNPMANNGPPAPGMGIMGMPPPAGIMGGVPPGGNMGMRPGGGMPMGVNGMRPGGMTGRPMMPPPAGGMNGGRPGGAVEEEPGQRDSVTYVEIDDKKLEGKRLAFTVYPKRMVVVQASFPYKAQLEEIRKALRLDKLSDVLTTPDAMPVFHGVIVQRRYIGRDGKPSDWEEFDYIENYKPLVARRKAYKDEDPKLAHVMLHDDHKLVMPLPELMKGTYPDPETPDPANPNPKTYDGKPLLSYLPTIKDTLAALAAKKPVPPPAPPSRLKGEGDVFDRGGGSKSQDVLYQGQPKLDPKFGGMDGLRFPGMKKQDGTTNSTTDSKQTYEPPDFILIRIVDVDVEPGTVYEYRMQVRMQNPNWVGTKDKDTGKVEKPQKYDLMSRPTDADIEILPEEHFDADQVAGKRSAMSPAGRRWDNDAIWNRSPVAQVSFPPESFFYATEPPAVDPKEKKNLHELKPGQAMLQFQRWMQFVKFGTFEEPVGDWVVSDVVVTRGIYVGGRQYVNLPLWSSEVNHYVLREVSELKARSKEPPKRGVMMDPTTSMPTMLVVEVEGGKQSPRIGNKRCDDDSASEILLMYDDGTLRVHDSYIERQNPQRKDRENLWNTWINNIDKATDELMPRPKDEMIPKKKSIFD